VNSRPQKIKDSKNNKINFSDQQITEAQLTSQQKEYVQEIKESDLITMGNKIRQAAK
jgi:hypothetical protein